MKKIIYALTVTTILLLNGCFENKSIQENPSNTGNINNPSNSKATITGKVTDINNSAISGAVVSIGKLNAVTDVNGNYILQGITSSERIAIRVSHPDFLENSRIVKAGANQNVSANIKLGKAKTILRFSALTGATVTQGDATVQLPANGFVDVNGNPYNGDIVVSMAYYPITTQSGRATFPGTFEGKNGNDIFPIQSYGFMNVELKDNNGNPVNLAQGYTAILTYPADFNLPTPATIPLWYYDHTLGYWIKEGAASYNNGKYTGTVSHFTAWNLDAPGKWAKLSGCVEDTNGNRISHALVQFRSANWDSYTVHTGDNGEVSVYRILAENDLTFFAYTKIDNYYYYGEYPSTIRLIEGENRILGNCIQLQQQALLPDTITVRGHVENSGNYITKEVSLVQGQGSNTIDIYDAVSNQKVATAPIDNNGDFSITFHVTDALLYSIGYYRTIVLKPHKTLYDVGTIGGYGEPQ